MVLKVSVLFLTLLGSEVVVADAALAASSIIPELYSRREFTPAWTSDDQIGEFVDLIGRSCEEGLDPGDYLYAELSALVDTGPTLRLGI